MWWTTLLIGCSSPEALPLPTPPPTPATPPAPMKWATPSELTSHPDAPPRWRTHALYAAADGIHVRSEPTTDGVVVRTVALGDPVRVLEPVGDLVTVGDRTDRWYRVSVSDAAGTQIGGYAFGGTLTPLKIDLPASGPVVVTWSPDHQPRLRYRTPEGELRARDLGAPSEGGTLRLTEALGAHRVDRCLHGACTRWVVAFTDHIDSLPGGSDPEPVGRALGDHVVIQVAGGLYGRSPSGGFEAEPQGGCEVWSLRRQDSTIVHELDFLDAFEPPEGDLPDGLDTTLACVDLGGVPDGRIVSCGWADAATDGRAWVAPRFLVRDTVWHPLPAASVSPAPPVTEALYAALTTSGVTIGAPDDHCVQGLASPPILSAGPTGFLGLVNHLSPQDGAGLRVTKLADDARAGALWVRDPAVSATRTWAEMAADPRWSGGMLVNEPDGSTRTYAWRPWVDELAVPASEPDGGSTTWTTVLADCSGHPAWVTWIATDVDDEQLVHTETLLGVQLYRLRSLEHPLFSRVHARLLAMAAEAASLGGNVAVPDTVSALWDLDPMRLTRDPWNRWVVLLRSEWQLPRLCD